VNGELARLHFVVPDGIDDHRHVSGGNVYDQHLRDSLRDLGWSVTMVPIAEPRHREAEKALAMIPDGALIVIDGLVAVQAAEVLADHAQRLRIVVLAHMVASRVRDDGERSGSSHGIDDRERTALGSASRIITTSEWTRDELVRAGISPDLFVVAQPGVDPAPASTGSTGSTRLLCVGAVAPHKGQDLLLRALITVTDIGGWSCRFVGSRAVAPDFVDGLTEFVEASGLSDRVSFTGILTGSALAEEFDRADLLVAPSRVESYGMAAAEASAHGVLVLATRVGGLSEALGHAGSGILVPPGDAEALAAELRAWLTDPAQRSALRSQALAARAHARSWRVTSGIVASSLYELERVP
jgi:glycosyltransferase involved in cell wall biosynthesis